MTFQIHASLGSTFVSRQLGLHSSNLTRALERLSSGYRLNRSSDGAASLALADKFRTQIRGFQQAERNIGMAINFVRTAEDAMSEVVGLLQNVRDLALQSISSSLTASDRNSNQTEVTQLLAEITRIGTTVKFNGQRLLDGSFASTSNTPLGGGSFQGSIVFQVGVNNGDKITTRLATQTSKSLGVSTMSVATIINASASIAALDSAIGSVLRSRAKLGAVELRLESAERLAGLQADNLINAESAIRDADIAAETVNFTKQQILAQTSAAIMAQVNSINSKTVLSLFGL